MSEVGTILRFKMVVATQYMASSDWLTFRPLFIFVQVGEQSLKCPGIRINTRKTSNGIITEKRVYSRILDSLHTETTNVY